MTEIILIKCECDIEAEHHKASQCQNTTRKQYLRDRAVDPKKTLWLCDECCLSGIDTLALELPKFE